MSKAERRREWLVARAQEAIGLRVGLGLPKNAPRAAVRAAFEASFLAKGVEAERAARRAEASTAFYTVETATPREWANAWKKAEAALVHFL
jgi:hypothetical protein